MVASPNAQIALYFTPGKIMTPLLLRTCPTAHEFKLLETGGTI